MNFISFSLSAILMACVAFASAQPGTPAQVDNEEVARMADSLLGLKIFDHNKQKLARLQKNKYGYDPDSVPVADVALIKKRLAKLDASSPFKYEYNYHVAKYVDMYSMRKRRQVERMLGLAQLYYPLFEEKLDKYDLPLELKHLAVVESALNPKAKSRAGAVGLWQFMYATGKMYGLNTSSYLDERSDPWKSTEAACKYLKSLHNMFGDWHLALAAYNAGPGTVNKAIRRSGGKTNYWDLMPYLPGETNGYVPAFIAASYVMTYHQEHNLYPATPKYFLNEVDTVYVKQQVTLDQISAALGIDREDLEFLNPAFHKNVIPVYEGSLPLCIPSGLMGEFLAQESSIYSQQEKETIASKDVVLEKKEVTKYHTVRSGEHLSLIARKYNVSVTEIRSWNKLKSNYIYAGQKLKVVSVEQQAVADAERGPAPAGEFKVYTVQSGDTLWDIANRHRGVSVEEIMKANNLRDGDAIRPGMKLKIGKTG